MWSAWMKPNLNELWNFCSLVDFSVFPVTTTKKESQTHTCIPTCFWVPQPFSTPSQVSGCEETCTSMLPAALPPVRATCKFTLALNEGWGLCWEKKRRRILRVWRRALARTRSTLRTGLARSHIHNNTFCTHAVTGDRVKTKYGIITEAQATPALYTVAW